MTIMNGQRKANSGLKLKCFSQGKYHCIFSDIKIYVHMGKKAFAVCIMRRTENDGIRTQLNNSHLSYLHGSTSDRDKKQTYSIINKYCILLA